jgi:imidazolonepropionase-like amidohydrolase
MTMSNLHRLQLLVGVLFFGFVLPAKAQAECVALVGGEAFVEGAFKKGLTVMTQDERIVAVGGDVNVPKGCRRIDAKGKIVTPGLIHPLSNIGLVEVELEAHSVDSRGPESPQGVRASFGVHEAYNPRSVAIPVARIAGVTSALIAPGGGIVSGTGAWVDLKGASQGETVKRTNVAVYANLGRGEGSRATKLHILRTLLNEARIYQKKKPDWEKQKFRRFQFSFVELEAMLPVLKRELPLVVYADRASLAKAKVPVIVNAMVNAPENFDRIYARADNAMILSNAGVPVMLTASRFGAADVRKLTQAAGNAVRAGMDHDKAIAALTQVVAETFGMTDYGKIAVGARANLVVWSGDPLELSTLAEHVLISGQTIPLVSRQTKLRERYRVLPGTSPNPSFDY